MKKLIRKIDDTGKMERRSTPGSGRTRTARLVDKIDEVDDLVPSRDNVPNTHRTQRQIARQTGISLTSVKRIVKNDFCLKCLKKRQAQGCMILPFSPATEALSCLDSELYLVYG